MEILNESEIWLASLPAKSFSELNEMLSHILPDQDRNKLIREVIRMSKDYFSIHEWEKEKCEELVRLESKRIDRQEGIKQGIELGKEETILLMLKNNMNLDLISKVTNKTIPEIKEIKKAIE